MRICIRDAHVAEFAKNSDSDYCQKILHLPLQIEFLCPHSFA